jgi:signal recognition particle subunit SRP54
MFTSLTERLGSTFRHLTGRGRLSEENIQEALREVRMALLEADVALPTVKQFIEQVREKAIGQEVMQSLTPDQALVKIVNEELTHLMGDDNVALDFNAQPPVVILMAGLQGAGKTTTVGKLAKYLQEREHKKVMVASTDIYRPAAIDQLATLAQQISIAFHPAQTTEHPINIAKSALDAARKQFIDVLIIDTAGRLHIDDAMMQEIKALHDAISPTETLFVVDSMTGQDAANTAKAFNEALPLTGVILTKTDGDARGGAALSIRAITGKPIKFIGTGEKMDGLEPFHPERIAQRILGMGDVLSLIEEVERKVDKKQADKLAKKIHKGKKFDLEDFRDQLKQMQNMGGITSLLDKLPGMGGMMKMAKSKVNDKMFTQMEAILNSMTPKERRYPDVIRGSRKRRIALGSGTQIQDLNRLLKQYEQMQKMLKKFSKAGGMKKMMRNMQGFMSQHGGEF